jgi:protein SCO1/2
MKNLKALILGLLLLVPILILAFVSIFGEHHFTLKTYFPKLDASGEVQYAANGDTIFQQVPRFSLTSHTGKAFTAADLEESIYVTNFFYTSCPESCRKISSQLVRVQEAFEDYPVVKIVSVTVEPERDSKEVLQTYARQYGAKEGKWYFLRGDRQEVYKLAQEGFQLKDEQEVEGQDIIQTDKLMLVDKEGKVRGLYDGTSLKEIDRLITEINVLVDEYSKRK